MIFSASLRSRHRVAAGAVALALGAAAGRAQSAEAIIARARAYLGGDAALNAIHSVHFVGTMQEFFGDTAKPVESTVEIMFQKPCQQRIIRVWPDHMETTGLDDLEAWLLTQQTTGQRQGQLSLLVPDIVKRLRANTWENLYFYQGLEREGGTVQLLGPAKVDGVDTVKVAFIHDPGIVFIRYFDPATGRLVQTETEQGGRITEEGEIRAGGVHFPEKVTTVTTAPDPQGRIVTKRMLITFTKITVNEVFPDSLFAVPPLAPPDAVAARTPAAAP